MSSTTLNRIQGVLHRQFDGQIDMSDWATKPEDKQEAAFLSRALAAQAIRSLVGADPALAGQAVVDSFLDGGIDAIHFDAPTDTLFIVQSKWSGNGNSGFDEGAISKYVNGLKRIFQADFSSFNQKIKNKGPEIQEVLYSDRHIRVKIITIHTAKQSISPHVKRIVDEFISEMNDPIPHAEHIDYDQAGVYELITAESRDPKIKFQAVLNDWGQIDNPFLAYYGRVPVSQVIQWWSEHGNKLFSQNLRLFYQSSSVNDALKKTLQDSPENFWYFNNGITIIADKVTKGLAGSPAHKFANFTCDGASVVNGAQTVGTIGNNAGSFAGESDIPDSWVQVRLISLEKCPPDFGRRITRAANLQNAVGNREFAAMDPLQHRLAVEFALDKRRYVYKSGDPDPRGEVGCSIVEATQALGCAHSVRLAVEVKREIGTIWADTDSAPYTDIFPEDLPSNKVWRHVAVMRATDEIVQLLRYTDLPRADLIGAHLQRIILHLVFRDPSVRPILGPHTPLADLVAATKAAVQPIFEKIARYLEARHPNDYLANFSKNTEKCERLVAGFNLPQADPGDAKQADLFK